MNEREKRDFNAGLAEEGGDGQLGAGQQRAGVR